MQKIALIAAVLLGCTLVHAQTYKRLPLNPTGISYGNTSLDACEIRRLSAAGDFVNANLVYSVGKFAFRNASATPPTYRFVKRYAGNAYVGEQTYDLFSSIYGASFFDLKWLGAAINGTGEYANINVRKGAIDVFAQAYAFLYGLHEVDEAFITGFVSVFKPALGNASLLIEENDHGYSVYNGAGRCSVFATINANTCKKGKSPAVDIQKGFIAIQAAGVGLRDKKLTLAKAFAGAQAGRRQILDGVWKTFVRMALELLRQADQTSSASKKLELRAGALAAFKVAAPITASLNKPVSTAATASALADIQKLVTTPSAAPAFRNVKGKVASIFAKSKSIKFSDVYDC